MCGRILEILRIHFCGHIDKIVLAKGLHAMIEDVCEIV